MEKTEQLVQFLARLNAGENPAKLKSEYRETLALIEPIDLAWAGQHLLETKLTAYDFCRLCEKITNLLGDQVAILRAGLSAGHPMQRIFFQHKRYLRILDNIEDLAKSIASLHPAWSGCPEYQRLRNLVEDINWMERHTQAEQDVLLPEMEHHGGQAVAQIIRYQHLDLEKSYKKLKALAGSLSDIDFHDLVEQLNSTVQWIVPVGRMHITVEENVFYPIAASFIESKTTWDKFLAICNQPERAESM